MDEISEQRDNMKNIFNTSKRGFLFGFRKEPKLMSINLVIGIFLSAIVYLQLSSFSKIVNEIIHIKNNGGFLTHALFIQSTVLALSFLIPAILQNFYNRFSEDLRMKMGTHGQLWKIDAISNLDIGTIESSEFQTKLERAEQWGTGCITNLIMLSFNAIRNIAGVLTSAVILYFINPWLVLLAILGGLPVYFIQKKYGFELYSLYHDRTDEARVMGDRNSFFRNAKKIVEILLFNLVGRFRSDVENANIAFDNKVLKVSKRRSFATFGSDLLSILCLLLAITLVTIQTIHGQVLVGALLLAFTTYRSFTSIVQDFYSNLTRIEDQARYSKRWFDLFDTKPKMISKPDAIKPHWPTPPIIEFKNVFFKYPETDVVVLKNISFLLESGEKLAIVGLNGAGKTTLIKLLCKGV